MSEIEQAEIMTRVNEILNRRPTVRLAVGVVRHGSLEFFHGHGVADIASGTPVTEDTVFRIASITKTVTAIAVLQLWEQGLVDLDAPAGDYLRAYRLLPAKVGFRPATVRHLLTHTSGIPELPHPSGLFRRLFGETVPAGRPVPPLAEYYRGRLCVEAEPGTRFIYTDHGFATLGQIVEDVSGLPLDRYFREHIFGPLGMVDTELVRSGRIRSRLATGYTFSSRGAKAVADYEMVPAAASSVYSSPGDMARYLAALLGDGASEHGCVLKPATLATMFEPHYQPDPRVPGIGLGFWRYGETTHTAALTTCGDLSHRTRRAGCIPIAIQPVYGRSTRLFQAAASGFTANRDGSLKRTTYEVKKVNRTKIGNDRGRHRGPCRARPTRCRNGDAGQFECGRHRVTRKHRSGDCPRLGGV